MLFRELYMFVDMCLQHADQSHISMFICRIYSTTLQSNSTGADKASGVSCCVEMQSKQHGEKNLLISAHLTSLSLQDREDKVAETKCYI